MLLSSEVTMKHLIAILRVWLNDLVPIECPDCGRLVRASEMKMKVIHLRRGITVMLCAHCEATR